MPKKPKPKAYPATPQNAVSPELLAKAYRLVVRSGIPAKKRTVPAMSIDDIVALSQTPEARAKTIAYIRSYGVPLYSADPNYPGLIVEVSPDGTRRLGRFVNRKFIECIMPATTERHLPIKPSQPLPMSPDNGE